MASSNVSQFLSTIGQGVKPNMFLINIQFPSQINGGKDQNLTNILCKSAALPGSNLGVIEVPFRGRRIKIPGDRTYADWTATFINDDNQNIRKSFDNWLNSIVDVNGENALRDGTDSYRCTITVSQLKPDGSVARKYKLFDAFPTDVSAIDLSYDTTDAVQEFTVTFQYHYLDVGVGDGEPAAGSGS